MDNYMLRRNTSVGGGGDSDDYDDDEDLHSDKLLIFNLFT